MGPREMTSVPGGQSPSPRPTAAPESAAYWRTRLAGAVPVELPTDRPRLVAREYRAATEEARLPGESHAAFGELGARLGVSSLTVMLGAFALTLERYTGQRDVLIGTPANGTLPTATPGAGQLIVLPVRLTVGHGALFDHLIHQTSGVLRNAFHHRHALRDGGIAAMLAGDPDSGPLVRVTVAASPTLGDGPGQPEGIGQPSRNNPDIDVALSFAAAADGTIVRIGYNASLFTALVAGQLLIDFTSILQDALARPRVPVRHLRLRPSPPQTPAWALPVPAGFIPAAPAGPTESLAGRFAATAARFGDQVAVRGPSGEYRYAELDRLTTAMAGRLRAAAPGGRRVALLCAHDIGLAVGVWSALKAGAAYVPLDPRQPANRLNRITADADVAAIACDPALTGRAAKLAKGIPVVPLAAAAGGAGAPEVTATLPAVPASALAYLLYTSGSTGRPKAVMQNHRNVLAHALAYANRIRIGAGDRIPLLACFTFDAAVMDIFGALLTGATLAVVDPVTPAEELRASIATTRASIMHCTPTLFRHLLSALPNGGEEPMAELSTVRTVVLGGEQVSSSDLRQFFQHFPDGCALVNGLGPTECTVALQHLTSRVDLSRPSVPVGHPVEGTRVRLLSEDGHPTEVFGELEIVGEHVALGYWRQPELTSRAFGRHSDGTPYYRTGDLARRLLDGSLVFCGRKDRQAKIRGHRVEPAEVEAVIRAHPTVAQAAVAIDQRSGSPQLVGYVTSATALGAEPAELDGYLRRQLPDYAVPARIVRLDEMPLGPTGKIDYRGLPAPDDIVGADDDTPQTPLERAVARIWCDVLGLSRSGMHTTFMVSGGDSVRLLDLLARVRDEFGAEIDLLDFLNAPTIATIVRLIEKQDAASPGRAAPGAPLPAGRT